MHWQNEKCVMVIDENLPLGVIANTAADFSGLAQGCKTYDEFIEKMSRAPESSLQYFGVAICGPKRKVNQLTGSMPLLR